MGSREDSQRRLRVARLTDIARLEKLEAHAFRGVYANHRWERQDFLYRLRSASAARFAVIVADGRIVGYVAGIIERRRSKKTAWLESIAVDPAYQRRGYGRQLLAWFLRKAHRARCADVVLEVSVGRRTTRRLFERAGFTMSRTLPDYYGPGRNALRMRRSLA